MSLLKESAFSFPFKVNLVLVNDDRWTAVEIDSSMYPQDGCRMDSVHTSYRLFPPTHTYTHTSGDEKAGLYPWFSLSLVLFLTL